jgi:hypothetical protein|nr:MAG TPA: hypothetical protein [Caudoviricetes sp.]
MSLTVRNKKKELKNSWELVSNRPTIEVMDSFLIEMFVMYSYDNLDEPPFSLGKDLQKALNLSYDSKFAFIDGVLKGGNKCLKLGN